MNMFRLCFN